MRSQCLNLPDRRHLNRKSAGNLRGYEVILEEMNETQTGIDAEDQVKGGDEQDDRKKELNR